MADTTQSPGGFSLRRLDAAILLIGLVLLVVALFEPHELWPTITAAANSIRHTAPFILFAVATVAFLKATGAETLLARAFQGNQARMIVAAALIGGLAPFCSCEVIPFIAAMLALGAPLGAVMAFWLASPLMDPAMFLITSSALGWEFAIGKAVLAVALGIFGGAATWALTRTGVFDDVLREQPKKACGSGCGTGISQDGKPVWAFWTETARRDTFRDTAISNTLFLGKWLVLAYVVEAVMLRHISTAWIGSTLGGEGVGTIALGALVGAPAYLNGYAAVPLVGALISQGMSQGAAMAFVIAGGVSCIPAAIAVWALVKPRVFFTYVALAITGAFFAGIAWQAIS